MVDQPTRRDLPPGYAATDQANRLCPCGSYRSLSGCCGVYLAQQMKPATAEALMRSRYTAFVLGDADYLLATWDPVQRPSALDLTRDRTEWLGLQILETVAGGATDLQGQVLFVARFRLNGKNQELRENSSFRKAGDRWLYVDGKALPSSLPEAGTITAARPNIGRNDRCPCGSGQKYKRCCGKS